jgi:FkbH-like protein
MTASSRPAATASAPPEGPAHYLRQSREVEARWKERGEQVTRFAVLGSFTVDFLRPFLIVEGDRIGVAIDPWFGPFGQFEQLVLDGGSALWARPVDVAWVALRIEDVDPRLAQELPSLGPEERQERVARVRRRATELAKRLRERGAGAVLVSSFAPPPVLDRFDANDPDGLVHVVAHENRQLARDLIDVPGANVFDWAGLVARSGSARFADPKLVYIARSPVAAANLGPLGAELARCVRAVGRPAAKCVVVDLDNTLWGGVLGDDGADALELGDAFPGSVFKDVQRALLELKARGFLLAIASKNDGAAVLDALDSHPEMLLRSRDFAAIEASWDPKPQSLRRIAGALNIGLDSLVFLDDSPVERAVVSAELPMVEVIDLPHDVTAWLPTLRRVPSFDRPRLLAEDRSRASMVAKDGERRILEQTATSVEAFLGSLEMSATVGRVTPQTLARVHQLILKTNQFNLTTRRHSLETVRRLSESPEAAVAWLRLIDRFGDLGLVCVGIVQAAEERVWEIDTLLMSCRVMGRAVEDAFLAYLAELALERGATRLRGLYQPTAKSTPVASFYSSRGFEMTGSRDGASVYERAVTPPLAWPAFIARSKVNDG